MKRKLIKQANQAITITLPIQWIRETSLKAGDEIDVEINEKDLILRSGKRAKGDSTKLNMMGFHRRMAYTYVNAAYAKGIDEMKLEFDGELYKNLNTNIGYAVISQKGDKYTIRDISGTSIENLDTIFKQVFQMILRFYDSAIEDIFGENKASMDKLRERDMEINKFALFLERSIVKHAYADSTGGKILFAYAFALEKIGDEIFRAWRTSVKYDVKRDKQIKELFLLSQKGLELAFEVYFQNNQKKVWELITYKSKLREKQLKIQDLDAASARFSMQALKIVEEAADLTHLALMMHL